MRKRVLSLLLIVGLLFSNINASVYAKTTDLESVSENNFLFDTMQEIEASEQSQEEEASEQTREEEASEQTREEEVSEQTQKEKASEQTQEEAVSEQAQEEEVSEPAQEEEASEQTQETGKPDQILEESIEENESDLSMQKSLMQNQALDMNHETRILEYGLGIRVMDSDDAYSTEDSFSFVGLGDAVLDVVLVQKDETEDWKIVENEFQYSFTMKNATKISTVSKQRFYIKMLGEDATLTLNYVIDGEKKCENYTIHNRAYKNLGNPIPGVKVSGSINHGVNIQISKGKYDIEDKYYRIVPSATDKMNKLESYQALEMANLESDILLGHTYKLSNSDSQTISLTFGEIDAIPNGTYKVNVVFGYLDDENIFIPDTKPVSVSMSKTAKGTITYTPITAVAFSKKDGVPVLLKGKGTNYDPETEQYSDICNALINRVENHFTDYFTLITDETSTYIALKDGLTIEQIDYIMGKTATNDRVGYINYFVSDKNRINQLSGSTKVTVSFINSNSTYTAKTVSTLGKATNEKGKYSANAQVPILSGKNEASIQYAYVENQNTSGFFVEDSNCRIEGKSVISLKSDGTNLGKKTISLFVIPTGFMADIIERKIQDEGLSKSQIEQLIKTYGVKIKATVTVEGVTVTGATKKNGILTINQSIDSKVTYIVKGNAGSYIKDVNVDVEESEVIENVTLTPIGNIETATSAQLTIQTKSVGAELWSSMNKQGVVRLTYDDEVIAGGEILLVANVPTLTTLRPTIKLLEATDTTFHLSLAKPDKIKEPASGKLLYRIISTNQSTQEKKYFYYPASVSKARVTVLEKETDNSVISACKFNIKVDIVQTSEDWDFDVLPPEKGEDKIVFKSFSAEIKNVSTKKTAYAQKISVKKVATNVFTGQNDIKIGTIQYDAKATFLSIDSIRDITNTQGITLYVTNNDIYMSVSSTAVDAGVLVGKHTIEVSAWSPAGALPATTTFTINIVQGMNQIEKIKAPLRMYKPAGKSATLQTELVYGITPYRKKVTYHIVDLMGNELTKDSYLYGKISVNASGKVSVKADFIPRKKVSDNQFRVEVRAADFSGNSVIQRSDIITITNAQLKIGRLMLAVLQDDGEYAVIDSAMLTPGTAMGARVIALESGQAQSFYRKNVYTEAEIEKYSIQDVSYTSNNKKAVLTDCKERGVILSYLAAPINKITFTAKVTDGGKASSSISFKVQYDTLENPLGLGIRILGKSDEYNTNHDIEVYGTTSTVLEVKLLELMESNTWNEVEKHWYQHSLSVKNGVKIGEQDNNTYYFRMSGKELTFTLGYGTKQTVKYKVKNLSYMDNRSVAPTVKVIGNINHGITLEIKKGKYAMQNKHMRLQLDPSEEWKNPTGYGVLKQSMNMDVNTCIPVSDEDIWKMGITFENPQAVPNGKYKCNLLFGNLNEEGELIPDTKPISVIFEKKKNQTISYKPVSSITIYALDDEQIVLQGSGSYYDATTEEYSELRDALIGGKANHFNTYFELSQNANGQTCLSIKEELSRSELEYLIGKDSANDKVGYIGYSVWDKNRSIQLKGYTKVTVKVKGTRFPNQPITSFSLSQTCIEQKKNTKVQLELIDVLPRNAAIKNIVWESTNADVAVVKNGLVTLKSEGMAVIKASAKNGVFAKCLVIVLSDDNIPQGAITPQMYRTDKEEDDTKAFNDAINSLSQTNNTLYVPTGTYRIDAIVGITLKSNINLIMAEDAKIVALANDKNHYDIIQGDYVHNVNIIGGQIIGERYLHKRDSGGEWGMGIGLYDSKDVMIDSVTITDCWGDGIYLGSNHGSDADAGCRDITIKNTLLENNRRNNLSIVSGDYVTVENCKLYNANGTSPESGIDIETNYNSNPNENITIKDTEISGNKYCGIQIVNAADNIRIVDCQIKGTGAIYNWSGTNISLEGANTIIRGEIAARKGILISDDIQINEKTEKEDVLVGEFNASRWEEKQYSITCDEGLYYQYLNVGEATVLRITRTESGNNRVNCKIPLNQILFNGKNQLTPGRQYRLEYKTKGTGEWAIITTQTAWYPVIPDEEDFRIGVVTYSANGKNNGSLILYTEKSEKDIFLDVECVKVYEIK